MYHIMIVEDDPKIVELVKGRLEQYHYQVSVSNYFNNIKSQFIEVDPDLVLMDINLPEFDGFYWCREIRRISKVPIIFLSARDSDMDLVYAIENGGDDYITKPFSQEILLAKIKSVLRRSYGEYKVQHDNKVKEIANIYLNNLRNTVEKDGKSVTVNNKEMILLNELLNNINEIVYRDELLMKIWDDKDFVDDNTLSVNINRLRNKLETIGIFNAIETIRGQGYMLKNNWSHEHDN